MRAFLLLFLFGLSACTGMTGGQRMGGITWRASDLNGVPLVEGTDITLQITGRNQVSGSAGCNRYSGTYRLMNREGIDFDALSTTRMACAPATMEQEQRFLSILGAVEGYSFYSDGGMSLISPDGRAIRFRR